MGTERKIGMQDIAVMSVQYAQYSFDYFLKSMETCGVKNVDMWGGAPHYCRLDYNTSGEAAKAIRELKDRMAARGMKTVMYTPETLAYPYSYSTSNDALRARTIDYMKHAMEDALEFGTHYLFMNTGCHSRDMDREEGMKRTIESYAVLCEYAKRYGVELVFEQLQPYESDLCVNIEDMKRIVKEVNSDALKICIDITAMNVAGETLQQYFDVFGKKLYWVHYSDSHHLALGEGDYGREKLADMIHTLERNGYEGLLDLEINDSVYLEDPHAAIEKSVDYLKTLLVAKL